MKDIVDAVIGVKDGNVFLDFESRRLGDELEPISLIALIYGKLEDAVDLIARQFAQEYRQEVNVEVKNGKGIISTSAETAKRLFIEAYERCR